MNTNPRLRRNLRFIQQTQDGVVTHVVKDPVTLKYFKFGSNEVALMQMLDGSLAIPDVVGAARERLGIASSAEAIDRFVHRLKEMGLVERTQEERSALMLEYVRRDRKSRMKGHGGTVLRMRFSLGDPDALLGRMNTAFAFFFTPAFIAASTFMFVVYAFVIGTHWAQFTAGMTEMYTIAHYTPGFVMMLYLTLCVIFLVHEFGHGLTCKHFGGEVHELGVMLIYFTPAFFCNVNDAWTFEKKSERLWVTFAGGWIQLLMASFAALVWITTEKGTLVNKFAFLAVLIGGGLTVLLNFNPLMPLDGYYALVDWTGIPNLRKRAMDYTSARIKQVFGRTTTPLPPSSPREARIFVTYGILAMLYITVVLSLLALKLGKFMGRTWGPWGLAVFLYLVYRATGGLRRSLRTSVARLKYKTWPQRMMSLFSSRRAFAVIAILILPFIIPWTIKVSGRAVVESTEAAMLRPPEAGRVESVLVKEGDIVKVGQPLMILRNPQLELELTRARAAIGVLEQEIGAAMARHDYTGAQTAQTDLSARSDIAKRLQARREALTLRAPFAARVVTEEPADLIGASAAAGDSLIELESTGALRARLYLAQRDIADIARGDDVHVKFPVRASATWRTHIAEVAAAASNGDVEVLVPLTQANSAAPLMAGMTGIAKVAVRRTNIAGASLRALRRILRTDLLL